MKDRVVRDCSRELYLNEETTDRGVLVNGFIVSLFVLLSVGKQHVCQLSPEVLGAVVVVVSGRAEYEIVDKRGYVHKFVR